MSYLLTSYLGTPTLATDDKGDIVEMDITDVFGNYVHRDQRVDNALHTKSYTGHEYDDVTGNIYAKARYLDTRMHSFLSADPMLYKLPQSYLIDPQQMNSYAYARNNPIIYTDPDGKFIFALLGIVAIIVGITEVAKAPANQEQAQSYSQVDRNLNMAKNVTAGAALFAGIVNWGSRVLGSVKMDPIKSVPTGNAQMGTSNSSVGSNVTTVGPVSPAYSSVPSKTEIWTSTKTQTSSQRAASHYEDHGKDFPGLTQQQYVDKAASFLTDKSSGIFTKIRSNGDILRYEPSTNTFGAYNQYGTPRTLFKPDNGLDYWLEQY